MSHPTDLLADLVAGRLDEPGRSQVLEHVRGCPACTAEVRAATAARDAMRGLPLPATPPGLGDAAIEAARGARGGGADRSRLWAGLAVAAVIVLAVAIALPRLGGEVDDPTFVAAESAATDAAGTGPVTLEVVEDDFDLAGVRALADAIIAQQPLSAAATAVAGAGAPEAADAATDDALACLQQAFETLPGAPVRLLQARFDGSPVYLGVFAEGPGAGQPADVLRVLVASRGDCRVLSDSRFELPAE